ncbi:MAG: MBOAT family protein, partial [Rhodocyclaceae bacterium]|nr:MBOAT family protein [Rhodocyclaceae bacterium]
MLFNSYEFLLAYLPICLIGFFLLGRLGKAWGAGWLAFASIVFYGWWDARYVALLMLSILGNYLFGRAIAERALQPSGKRLLTLAVVLDLALLAYYKYADFFIGSVNALTGSQIALLQLVLPLGISFFTFTQIAFLVDSYRG